MFLLNSWSHHFIEAASLRLALSRSYSHNLPSSFSTAHPSALEYSSRLPVSVYGTGPNSLALEVFLGSKITVTINLPEGSSYYQLSSRSTHLTINPITTAFNALFRQCADLSLLRYSIETIGSIRILTDLPSASPFGLS